MSSEKFQRSLVLGSKVFFKILVEYKCKKEFKEIFLKHSRFTSSLIFFKPSYSSIKMDVSHNSLVLFKVQEQFGSVVCPSKIEYISNLVC